ncbi:MAG: hypothetical protein K8H86_01260 [Ignavibacteriaceae bacterium]|nr:hypothetical protein [Ignavibacteriaceae bacterium]
MSERGKEILNLSSRIILIISGIIGIGSIVIEYGFRVSHAEIRLLHYISMAVVFIFVLYQFIQLYIIKEKLAHIKQHKFEYFIISFILVEFFLSLIDLSLIKQIGSALDLKDITFLYIVFAHVYIILGIVIRGLRYNMKILQSRLHPTRIFILSFLVTILTGALLLMLPASTVSGKINFIDALFTSTSAVCVTGLITVDTATYFTTFGQIIIMLLFQTGGLGLMTFTTFFAIFLSGGLGIRERILLHDLLNEENIGAITRVLVYLLVTTFVIEIVGAMLLFQSIHTKFDSIYAAAFNSLFHSVSAFCNAGFSLFTLNLMDPSVQHNYLFLSVISFLIILGGLGFPTIFGFFTKKTTRTSFGKIKITLNLQNSIVIFMTLFLIVGGTILFYLLENSNTLTGLNELDKWFQSYFQSVTTRTAGFNSLNISQLTVPTSIMFLFLMFVGAGPGGTAGGIRVTTFAIIVASVWSIIREQRQVKIGNRSIPNEIVVRSLLKMFMTILFITLVLFGLTFFEDKSLLDLAFECFSAFGTVGLSRGITPMLTVPGKLGIIILMFIGRIGPLAFIYGIIKAKEKLRYDLPSENISIL